MKTRSVTWGWGRGSRNMTLRNLNLVFCSAPASQATSVSWLGPPPPKSQQLGGQWHKMPLIPFQSSASWFGLCQKDAVTGIWANTMNATRAQVNHLPANVSHRHATFYLPNHSPHLLALVLWMPHPFRVGGEHITMSGQGGTRKVCVCCMLKDWGRLLFCCIFIRKSWVN